jgi:hypothetical protein
MNLSGQLHAPAASPLGKTPGTHCTGSWVGSVAGLDGFGEDKIFSTCRDSIPTSSSSYFRCCIDFALMATTIIIIIIIIMIMITNNKPDIIRDNEQRTSMLIDVAVSGDRNAINP